jgi:hypothetical protein
VRTTLRNPKLVAHALGLLVLCASHVAVAQVPDTSTLRTIPSPPPADQPFDAVFGVEMHLDANAFYLGHAWHRVQGNNVDILFDISCAFICQGFEPEYREYPFEMPALAAGTYNVRFVFADFDNPSQVLGEFQMVVGGVPAPAQLPTGDFVPWLLGLLLVFAAFSRLRLMGTPLANTR